jgi:23S rRNA pseudouridine1911/1915/1917 synthase
MVECGVEGQLTAQVTVEQPVGRDPASEFFSRQAVVATGQPARTLFVPKEVRGGHTLVDVHPLTGRRHQIRVHAALLGHPVAGDNMGLILPSCSSASAAASIPQRWSGCR